MKFNTVHRLFTLIRERIYERTIKDDLLNGEVEGKEREAEELWERFRCLGYCKGASR